MIASIYQVVNRTMEEMMQSVKEIIGWKCKKCGAPDLVDEQPERCYVCGHTEFYMIAVTEEK